MNICIYLFIYIRWFSLLCAIYNNIHNIWWNILLLRCPIIPSRVEYRFTDEFHVNVPWELVKMMSLPCREVGDGLFNASRWKLTVWSHTAPGKPTLHSSLWEQWAGSSRGLIGTTLWFMCPGNKESWFSRMQGWKMSPFKADLNELQKNF